MERIRPVVAVAVITILVGVVLVPVVRAVAPAPLPSGLVPVVPCRLVDTRPTTSVGPWSEPVGPDSTITVEVRGINGNCTIPAAAVAIAANVTIVDPTAPSFLTLYPADAASVPNSSNLNWFAPSPPTPNHVTVGLSADGAIKVYNLAGTVHVIIDIVAYYTPVSETPNVTVPVTTTPAAPSSPPKAYALEPQPFTFLSYEPGEVFVGTLQLAPGTYVVSATATVVNFTARSDLFRCWIRPSWDSSLYLGGATARVGPGTDVVTLPSQAKLVVPGQGGFVRLGCAHDYLLSDNPYVEGVTIIAVEVS